MNTLKLWRQRQRESAFFIQANRRAQTMSEGELVEQIDLTLMGAGRSISRYRNNRDPEFRLEQLLETRMALEASMAMIEAALDKCPRGHLI